MTEITAAVQFAPLPKFDIGQVVAVGRELNEWNVVENPPAIPPMTEGPPGQPTPQAFFSFGATPPRVVLAAGDDRWVAQIQQDRVAVHERKAAERPSFTNVRPKLMEFSERVGRAVGAELFSAAHAPDIIEVIYDNTIAAADGGWSTFSELNRVLRVLSGPPGEPPYDGVEQLSIGFSYTLTEGDQFAGRLRVIGEPQYDENALPVLALRIASRRFVRTPELERVLELAHADIVNGFTAITTDHMHDHWGRCR